MKKKNIYSPFELLYEKVDTCPLRDNVFNYYQLVFILSGQGKQWINEHVVHYTKGDLFLLSPEDSHSFDVEYTTEFFLIKFNDFYVNNTLIGDSKTIHLIHILKKVKYRLGKSLYNSSDKLLVNTILDTLLRESINRELYNSELIQQLINTLILLVARNLSTYIPDSISEVSDTRVLEMLEYIQNNIYEPDKLQIACLAFEFDMSKTYISRFFKKHTNETIQQYIANHRLKLIESRLLYSDLRIGEITVEFGFTDESHLNHFFKKLKGVSPSAFRKAKNYT